MMNDQGEQTAANIPFAESGVQIDDRLGALDVTEAGTPGLEVLISRLRKKSTDVDVGLTTLVLQGAVKWLEW
jgi:hypothetical protein